MGFFNNIKKTLKFNKLRAGDTDKINEISQDMTQGRKIKVTNPMSERLSFNKITPEENEKLKSWKPEGDETSPEGFFQVDESLPNKEHLPAEKAITQASIPSTCLQSIEYNPKNEALYVKFQKGKKKYWYPGVAETTVTGLLDADSKGKYFWQNIHNQHTYNPGHSVQGNKNIRAALNNRSWRKISKIQNAANQQQKAMPEKPASGKQSVKINKFPWL